MKTNMIIARMGYAESSYASFLVFVNQAEEGFESPLEALQTLVHSFFVKYVEEYGPRLLPKACCLKFRERAEPEDKRCPTCGSKLQGPHIDLEQFGYFIHGHLTQPMDGYGQTMLNEIGPWTEFASMNEILKVPPEEVIDIGIYAERVMPLALRGDELDDPEDEYHSLAGALRGGVKEYWASHDWIADNPETREDFEKILEKYRLASGTNIKGTD